MPKDFPGLPHLHCPRQHCLLAKNYGAALRLWPRAVSPGEGIARDVERLGAVQGSRERRVQCTYSSQVAAGGACLSH
jgi:hypothetical protein